MVILLTITACATTNDSVLLPVVSELAHEIYTYEEETTQAISWQEAYSDKLLYYARLPITTTDATEAEWRFLVYDIDQDGVPELFLMVYYDGYISHRGVYGVVDGDVQRLKSALTGDFDIGLLMPPGSAAGIIRVQFAGHIARYDKLLLSENALVPVVSADFLTMADSFRINTHTVTEEEFVYVFGCRDNKEWLVLHEITEANIQDIIFGWFHP